MSKSNPFIGESESGVNSPVVSMTVNSCGESKRRRKRSVVGLSSSASTAVDINMDQPSRAIKVNETPSFDNDGILLSLFNLTSPGTMPILLQVAPKDPPEVNVFVRLNATPTSTDFDWFLTSGFNGTNNYTLYIPAELTTYVKQMFVGVQSLAGNVHC